jgi:hypothetical protein
VRAAKKLLVAPTIGGGECPGRGWWWRESKDSNTPPSHLQCTKTAKKGQFPALIDLKITKNTDFTSKYLQDTYTPRSFLRNILILIFFT